MVRTNAMLAECQLSGATGDMTALAIGGVPIGTLGEKLTRIDLLALLALRGISPIEAGAHQTARERVCRATKSWRLLNAHRQVMPCRLGDGREPRRRRRAGIPRHVGAGLRWQAAHLEAPLPGPARGSRGGGACVPSSECGRGRRPSRRADGRAVLCEKDVVALVTTRRSR